ncbi:DUF4296 domain-containing protein [Sodaliphilus sp.]|uniref:DUF4296 domain-containing protein n=1 Tax=Sodaliphilus sp. TaxID=2815818 RepID=UPI00388D8CE5
MKHLLAAACLVAFLCLAAGCDKAPKGVIPESKMEELLVDLELADAYIDSHWDQFPDDSSRLVLKQSIFMKHGITPELYDTSLVWYARNMDVYIKVYDNVIGRLQDMNKELQDAPSQLPVQGPAFGSGMEGVAANHEFAAEGDSADIWQGPRRWMLTSGMKSGFITFDLKPDRESDKGDRYELQYKLKPVRSSFKAFMAVDYIDGSTSIVNRFSGSDGWNSLALQGDPGKRAQRIYGYIYYNINKGDVAYIDSILMLRTHSSEMVDTKMGGQKLIERKKEGNTSKNADKVEAVASNTISVQGHFKPKEGVNKSSAQKHVTESPNRNHLPGSN